MKALLGVAHRGALRTSVVLLLGAFLQAQSSQSLKLPNPLVTHNASGQLSTYTTSKFIDTANPFFQNLGTNGRTCFTCHDPRDAWSITPSSLHARFDATAGLDPVFNSFDGTNCPSASTSTPAERWRASSLLLSKGLIRVSMAVPNNAEFTVEVVNDPYGCAFADNKVSVYRRPLPSTNVGFLSTVMWDGRESALGRTIHQSLKFQARDATTGHAQGAPPSDSQLEQIASFEEHLYTAQVLDNRAGRLDALHALGGPINLSRQLFFIGINDPLNMNPTGVQFNPEVFTIYEPWLNLTLGASKYNAQRQLIAQGAEVFNNKKFTISGVAGLNDFMTGLASIEGTCSICHDAPNAGDHSVSMPLNMASQTIRRCRRSTYRICPCLNCIAPVP